MTLWLYLSIILDPYANKGGESRYLKKRPRAVCGPVACVLFFGAVYKSEGSWLPLFSFIEGHWLVHESMHLPP